MGMTDEQKDFREKIVNHAIMCVKRKSSCLNEESCKQGMVLPFIALLGYDIFDINEVKPEHPADFSDKYKNRVDYAIMKDGNPVIAIECKCNVEKNDRGQLKSYFNACKSIKLGILTDGLVYEFFADCDSPNMMDDEPFISFNFEDFANGRIDDEQIKAIFGFIKKQFDPDNVGAEAKKKVVFSSIISFLEKNLNTPSEDFIRYLLSNCEGINQKITKRVLDENAELVKSAFAGFIDKRILDRVGLADKRFVKIDEKKDDISETSVVLPEIKPDIITTDEELYAYNYAKQRLAFLVKTDAEYAAIDSVTYKDHKTLFAVFYKKERKGSLFSFVENTDGTKTFSFPLIDKSITCECRKYKEIDDALYECFKKSVEELG